MGACTLAAFLWSVLSVFSFFFFAKEKKKKKREKLRPPFQVLISREYQILPDLGFMKAYLCTSCIIALAREREIRE